MIKLLSIRKMDQKTIEKIKEKLLKDKKRLNKELKRFAVKDERPEGDFDTLFPEIGRKEEENALEVASYTDNLPIEHSLELKLKDVNDSLEKIQKGTFGSCEKCGGKIRDERLEILPTARFCMKCHKEKGGKK